jgi:putative tricarboxylic transport membrane protein
MQNAGVWAGIVFLIYASGMFWQSFSLKYYTQFGPGPGLFPRWLSGILIVLALIFIWQSIKDEVVTFRDIFPKGKAFANVVSVWAATIVFMLILNYTGFIVASSILLFTLFIRGYNWLWALGLSVGVSVFLFLTFDKAFGIPLPVSVFGW